MKFKFSDANIIKINEVIKKYPKGKEKSAVMPLLYLAQEQNDGWISTEAMDCIANILHMPPMHVYEVASFYTMYNKKPIGKYLIQICRTTPCWLCSSDEVLQACKEKLNIDVGETTEDRMFSLIEVECIGACAAAPAIQINEKTYESVTKEKMIALIEERS